MSELEDAIGVLISELESFLDYREVSPRGDPHPVGPIEINFPLLYEAEQRVQQLMGGKLPMGVWEHWSELLELSRQSGGDPKRSRHSYIEADHLLTWAKSLATSCPDPHDYLDLRVEQTRRIVRRNGREATFENKSKAWLLFHALFRAQGNGKSRAELTKEVWGDAAVQPNNLDQQKRVADGILDRLGIMIEADDHGIWRLTPVVQSHSKAARNV